MKEPPLRVRVRDLVERRLERAGISRSELAERIAVPPSRITAILKGSNVTIDTLERIASALGCSVVVRLVERDDAAGGAG